MSHNPVCVKCSKDMYPKKNGVGVLDYAAYGPYQVWDADLWACPQCEIEIVVGFGQNPIARHDETDISLTRFCEDYKQHSCLIEVKP